MLEQSSALSSFLVVYHRTIIALAFIETSVRKGKGYRYTLT